MKLRRFMAKPIITVQARLDLEESGVAFAKLYCSRCKTTTKETRITRTTAKRGFPCAVCNE